MNFRWRVMELAIDDLSKAEIRCRAAEIAADADARCNRLLRELSNLADVVDGVGGTSPNAVETARNEIASCFRETNIWNDKFA